jgi:ferric-dicitrate binding protein FerR (iron transport regulator)
MTARYMEAQMDTKRWVGVLVVLAGLVGLVPAMASPVAIGSLKGSRNAMLDGQAPLPDTTMLSGDRLQVNDGLAMVTLDQGNRMILGRETEASFVRDDSGVTVALTRGNVSLYHPASGAGFRVKVGDVTVAPSQGFKTFGEVAMVDGLLLVTAKDGALQVEKAGTSKEVSAGKTITIATTAARAPAPVPPRGRRHLKRLGGWFHLSNRDLLIVSFAAEIAGAATAIYWGGNYTHGQVTQVSQFVP